MLIGAIQAGVTIGSTIAGAIDPKDKERMGRIDEAFRLAVAGNKAAQEWLKYRTGQYGVAASIPGAPFGDTGAVGGYGSQESRTYATSRYNTLIAQLNLMGQVEQVGEKIAPVVQKEARAAGYEILPQWVLWVGAAAVVFLVLKKGAAT